MQQHLEAPMFQTPILFLVFNRIDVTKQVFQTIESIKPRWLYIASDGPREAIDGEERDVFEIRKYVTEGITWECEVKTLFRDSNLGCKKAVSEAITWFFRHEDSGIILEDDCLPSVSFFHYCDTMLKDYKDDERIWMIGGFNANTTWDEDKYDYFYSKYGSIWGWATWKRAWESYQVDLKSYSFQEAHEMLLNIFETSYEKDYFYRQFLSIKNNKIDTWDYQWQFIRLINNGLTIIPTINLIRNIGFDDRATHTNSLSDPRRLIAHYDKKGFKKKPKYVVPDMKYDRSILRVNLKNRIKHRIKKVVALLG